MILGREALDPALFEPLPPNVLLVPFAPQLEVIRRAALCITHAGLNTALDCVIAGVPMVAIPIASEQPGVAARIAHHGLGTIVPLPELSTETLSTAVATVLADSSFRTRAHALASEVSRLDPTSEAIHIINRVLEHPRSTQRMEPAPAPPRMTE